MNNNSGSSVRMNSTAVIDICEKMSSVLRNMNDHVQQIYELRGKLNSNWQGNASRVFFEEFDKINNELQDGKMKHMYEILVNVVNLIDENRKLSGELSEKDFENITKIQEMLNGNPTITGVEVSGISTPETSTITSDVNANNTITSVSTDFTANAVNTDLNNSVGIDTTIDSVVTDFEASGVNTDLNDSVGMDTTIENASDFEQLPETNQENLDSFTNPSSNNGDNLLSGIGAGTLGSINKGGV